MDRKAELGMWIWNGLAQDGGLPLCRKCASDFTIGAWPSPWCLTLEPYFWPWNGPASCLPASWHGMLLTGMLSGCAQKHAGVVATGTPHLALIVVCVETMATINVTDLTNNLAVLLFCVLRHLDFSGTCECCTITVSWSFFFLFLYWNFYLPFLYFYFIFFRVMWFLHGLVALTILKMHET